MSNELVCSLRYLSFCILSLIADWACTSHQHPSAPRHSMLQDLKWPGAVILACSAGAARMTNVVMCESSWPAHTIAVSMHISTEDIVKLKVKGLLDQWSQHNDNQNETASQQKFSKSLQWTSRSMVQGFATGVLSLAPSHHPDSTSCCPRSGRPGQDELIHQSR